MVHNRDFSNYFPDSKDALLKDAVSFIGISLKDKNENVIGMIAIASDFPIPDTNLAENILTIATSRAIIELEHQIEINNRDRYQQGLELIDDWIARLITDGYDEKAFFKNICRAAQEITKTQLAALPVLNNEQQTYNLLSGIGLRSEKLENTTLYLSYGGICA